MFLHSGASLHGHEYSNRPPPNIHQLQSPAHLRAPLLRTAFTPSKQRGNGGGGGARVAPDGTLAPVLRQRPASDYIAREPSPVVRFRELQEEDEEEEDEEGEEDDDQPPPTPATHDDLTISESELSDAALSLDGAASVARGTTLRGNRRLGRRPPRRSTTYYLGYPAPRIIGKTKVMQKVFLPRLLLQLQQVRQDGRSQPVLEVFPASRIAGPVVAPRLAKRFPGIFGVKRHLGYDDIVLVRRDDRDLHAEDAGSENDEGLEKRNLLAVYSPLKHSDEAEIVLDDGSVWVARPRANGSYDFVHTDAEGNTTTARWARRQVPAVTPTSVSTEPSSFAPTAAQVRYTFSILNPLTRRHPVMATLTPSTLNVQDTYTPLFPSHAAHPPITRVGRSLSMTSAPAQTRTAPPSPSKQSSVAGTSESENDSAVCIPRTPDHETTSQRTVHQVDDATKMLIWVTALWVALRSGWSQSYNPCASSKSESGSHDAGAVAPAGNGSSAATPRGRSRRNTWTTRSSTVSDAARLSDTSEVAEGARVNGASGGGRCLKRYSLPAPHQQQHAPLEEPRLNTKRFSASTPTATPTPTPGASRASTPTSTTAPPSAVLDLSNGNRPPPRRATSTGAAFMRRRLEVSASFASASGSDREGTGPGTAKYGQNDLDSTPTAKKGPQVRAPPAVVVVDSDSVLATGPTAAAVVGPAPQVEKRRGRSIRKRLSQREGGARITAGELGVDSESSPPEGDGKKHGMRWKLTRWFHKLGSSSSSSGSSSR